MSRPILEVSGLCMRFGGLLAVNNVALSVQPKQVVSMIGPNGAGKTTVFNCLTGFYQPSGGVILAAIVMILLPEMMREFSEYRMLMFGAMMVLMMIWRPQGLLPMQRPHMELRK